MLKSLIKYTHLAYKKGYVTGTGGNTSVRIGDYMFITPTGRALDEIGQEDFAKIDLKTGMCVNGKRGSKEQGLHRKIYMGREDIGAIFHLHSAICIAAILTVRETERLPCYVPGLLKKIGTPAQVAYYPAGSEQLAEQTAAGFLGGNGVWMRRHGLIAGGVDVRSAWFQAEDMIEACRIHLSLQGQGCLSQEEITNYLRSRGEKV